MYRDYEDPRELERAIDKACKDYEAARLMGASSETLYRISAWIEELKQRAAIAWEDEDYDAWSFW